MNGEAVDAAGPAFAAAAEAAACNHCLTEGVADFAANAADTVVACAGHFERVPLSVAVAAPDDTGAVSLLVSAARWCDAEARLLEAAAAY